MTILDFAFDGLDMIVTIMYGDNQEDSIEVYLEGFVPEDFQTYEKITGGYDTPDYETLIDEDFTSDEWYRSMTTHEQQALVMDAIKNKLK